MKKISKLLTIILLGGMPMFLIAQEDGVKKIEQDMENFKKQYQQGFEDFKRKREEQIRLMEKEYQDYYNELTGLKNYYTSKKDTSKANCVAEIIDYEKSICKATDKNIQITEKVVIENEAEASAVKASVQETQAEINIPIPPVQNTAPAAELVKPTETTFVPLTDEGDNVPNITPLPKPKAIVTSPFGERLHPILKVRKMHTGMDFGTGMDAEIYAAANGKVTLAKYSKTYGDYIIVEHKNGYSTVYAHLNKYLVKLGDVVKKGQVIGLTGTTGRSTGPHLHYEVRINGTPVNPAGYLSYLK
jgi:murein DD-endopeptidase MepM/ murein hydrolase activator NlpD